MCRTVLVVALLALSTPALAQRAAFSFDLRTVGAVDASPIDDDGNPFTSAWVLTLAPEDDANEQRFQLVVAKGGGFCFEAPFTVAGTDDASTVTIVREGKREMLKVVPSRIGTIKVDPETGQWLFVPPSTTYAPIELTRTLCG